MKNNHLKPDKPYQLEGSKTWIYPELPAGMRLATRTDLFTANNKVIVGKKLLLKNIFEDYFESYVTTVETEYKQLDVLEWCFCVYVKA